MSRAADLARRLGEQAEAVCRHYLPNGRRQGRYWICGDVMGTPGRSLYVRLSGDRAGKFCDAACWADNRGIPQIVFKPDWTRHRNAAPFKRNDRILEALPIGVIAFPGSGISRNLADKARKMGIAVWRFDKGEGGA